MLKPRIEKCLTGSGDFADAYFSNSPTNTFLKADGHSGPFCLIRVLTNRIIFICSLSLNLYKFKLYDYMNLWLYIIFFMYTCVFAISAPGDASSPRAFQVTVKHQNHCDSAGISSLSLTQRSNVISNLNFKPSKALGSQWPIKQVSVKSLWPSDISPSLIASSESLYSKTASPESNDLWVKHI